MVSCVHLLMPQRWDIRTVCHIHLRIRLSVGQVVAELAVIDHIVGKASCRAPVVKVVRAGIEDIDFNGILDTATADSARGGNIRR